MDKMIVYLKGGYAHVLRNIKERGYHIRLKCRLEKPEVTGLDRQSLIKRIAGNVEKILDGLEHPGYHRVDEVINSNGTYSLHLVPVTEFTMRMYLDAFLDDGEALADLEDAIYLINDEETRNAAMTILLSLIDEKFRREMEGDD